MKNFLYTALVLVAFVLVGGCSKSTDPSDTTTTTVKAEDFNGTWTVVYHDTTQQVTVDVVTEQYTGSKKVVLTKLGDVHNLYFLTAKIDGSTLSGISVGSIGYNPHSLTITYPPEALWNSTPDPDFVFDDSGFSTSYLDVRGKLELTISTDGKSFTGIYREAVEGLVPPSQTDRKWVLRSKTLFTGTRQ